MDTASNANSIPPRKSHHSKFIRSSASSFLQHEGQGHHSCSKVKVDIFHGVAKILFFPNIAKSFKTKGGSWQDFKRRLVGEVNQAALLYLAKRLETNKDKTYNVWVSQEPLCKTTNGKLPGHCKVTRYSKMTKQYIAL